MNKGRLNGHEWNERKRREGIERECGCNSRKWNDVLENRLCDCTAKRKNCEDDRSEKWIDWRRFGDRGRWRR